MEQFIEAIVKVLKGMVGDTYEIKVRRQVRMNDIVLYALNFIKGNQRYAKNIYIEPYYRVHNMGFSIEEMARKILDELHDDKEYVSMLEEYSVMDWSNFDNVKDKLIVRVASQKYNQEFLKDKCYIHVMDLAKIFYVLVERDDIGITSIAIPQKSLGMWNITLEQMEVIADKNMKRLFPAVITPLGDVMKEQYPLLPDECLEQIHSIEDFNVGMFILSNDSGVNGASLMLDKDVLREFADEHGVDEVILIPSSLHECMLVPKGVSIALTEKSCLEMLHDANLEAVERRELLSNNIYLYSRKNNLITMWEECNEQ